MRSYQKYLLMTLLLLGAMSSATGQAVRWSVKPSYDYIEDYTNSLLKVKKNGRSGLIDHEGKVVVDTYADSITTINNGVALILERQDSLYRIVSLYRDSTTVNLTGNYYLGDFPFYSENRLPVRNEKGFYGFLDEKGALAVPCTYASVFPFTEGVASVVKSTSAMVSSILGKNAADFVDKATKKAKDLLAFGPGNDQYLYINPSGVEVKMPFKMYYASPFSNGKATVYTRDGERLLIDKSGTKLRELKEDEVYQEFVDYNLQVTYLVPSKEYNGPEVFTELNKYGYIYNEKVMLPAQFEWALPFKGGYAIVKQDGKYGVLKTINGQFLCEGSYTKIPAANPDLDAIRFRVFTPSQWATTPVTLTCNVEGYPEKIEQTLPSSDEYGFRYYTLQLPRGNRTYSLSGDGILAWNQYMAEGPIISGNSDGAVESLTVSASASSIRADVNDRARFSVLISNDGVEAIEKLRVTITGSGISTVTKEIPLAVGESVSVPVTINAKGQASSATRKVSVALTVIGNGRVITKDINVRVIPFFE